MPNSDATWATIAEIMSSSKFALGVADARAGRGYHPDYDKWAEGDGNASWDYERGRRWAQIAPRTVVLKHNGRVTADAKRWFRKGVL